MTRRNNCDCQKYKQTCDSSSSSDECECTKKQNELKKHTHINGRIVVNNQISNIPCGTTIYTSNIPHYKDDNNIILNDTCSNNKCNSNNHSIFLGRNVSCQTNKGDTLAEFGGISSNSTHINGSIKFNAENTFKSNGQCQYTPTNATIELNNKTIASFHNICDNTNIQTDTITLKIYTCLPQGHFKEGTLAILKTNLGYKLIIYNGKEWENL